MYSQQYIALQFKRRKKGFLSCKHDLLSSHYSNIPHNRSHVQKSTSLNRAILANVHTRATLRLLYDAKWETNCRVAGWNGPWPRLSLINSVRWAPLITAACHRHAPLPQRAGERAPDLRAAAGRPHITHSYGHTHVAPSTLRCALFMHEFPDCQTVHNQNTVWVSSASLSGNRTDQKKKRKSFFSAPCLFFVTRIKLENANYSTKFIICVILNCFSIPPPSHTHANMHSALVCKLYWCNWCNDWK